MTNEEAIKMIVDDMRLHHGYLSGNYRKALNMAIEALRNSPTQMPLTSDPISRQDAIDVVSEGCQEWRGIFERCKEKLLSLPSAQPERKTGKWIEVNDADNRISGRCSICGWESHLYEDDVVGMDYCPNCGARLEAE